ncbi:MAG: phosphatase PAP2 family protein [Candidatus Symbiothrix sp.]|jgi:undecaprenyl-diphosphatase|nr:phosphatase PAP2 family protein [Candidatus Symbiothrix sp.]
MLEQELHWERDLFFFLNGSDSTFWDNFFYLYSYKWTWIPFYACLLFVFIYKRPWKEIVWTIVAVALLITLCDQVSSGFFKPVFHRLRPSHHPGFKEAVDLVFDHRGGGFGFISSHAANAFGLATFTALLFRNRIYTATIILFAVITAYSRVYLGLHFVSDIVVGSLVGVAAGYLIYYIYCWRPKKGLPVKSNYSPASIRFVSVAFFVFVAILLLFNTQLVNLYPR